MQEDSKQNKFDTNLDPKQTERLKEIFGLNKQNQFGDFMVDSSNKEKFIDKIKKEAKKNKNK